MFKIKNLCFGYIKQPLCLKDINLNLKEGEVACLIGGEGSGKTSLLRVLSGLEKQYFGQILLNEKDIKSIGIENQNFSYLPSEPVFFENKSLLENIKYVFKIKNINCPTEQQILEIFDKFNFNFPLNLKVKKLSKINKKVFSIIRTYFKNPSLILLDDLAYNEKEENNKLIKNAIYTLFKLKNDKISLLYANNCNFDLNLTNKYFYLSNCKIHMLNNFNDIKNNPIDNAVKNYFNYKSKIYNIKKDNNCYYFCADIDTKEIFYSETLDEHEEYLAMINGESSGEDNE